ncbi:hypothetical protein BDZ89DRAFT_1248312 [Hymenopellis radicata]|nr:hypothetical protein BDZ89DRAFT_1248312 [Hymenopellis radicata]
MGDQSLVAVGEREARNMSVIQVPERSSSSLSPSSTSIVLWSIQEDLKFSRLSVLCGSMAIMSLCSRTRQVFAFGVVPVESLDHRFPHSMFSGPSLTETFKVNDSGYQIWGWYHRSAISPNLIVYCQVALNASSQASGSTGPFYAQQIYPRFTRVKSGDCTVEDEA